MTNFIFCCILAGLLQCLLQPVVTNCLPNAQVNNNTNDVNYNDFTGSGIYMGINEDVDIDSNDVLNEGVEGVEEEETESENDMDTDTSEELVETKTCPNCCKRPKNLSSCRTGTSIGRVNHVQALGLQSSDLTGWSSCGLPNFPKAKYVNLLQCLYIITLSVYHVCVNQSILYTIGLGLLLVDTYVLHPTLRS